MAEKDKTEKILEDYNDVFADIFNTLVLQKAFLHENQLTSVSTESNYKAASGNIKNQFRDIRKQYLDNTLKLASFSIENQATIEKFMPLRVMKYDCITYEEQLRNDSRLSPTLTIVLNFSDKPWHYAKNLKSLMPIPEELQPHIQDYQILVFDIAFLEDEVIERFTSDFKIVARFFKAKRLSPHKFIWDGDHTAIKHVEAVMDLFKAFTGDDRFTDIFEEILKPELEKGETITMCEVLDAYINRGKELGRAEGRHEGETRILFTLVEDASITVERAAIALNCSAADVIQEMTALGFQAPSVAL